MQLRTAFNEWGSFTKGKFAGRQWLLAKWEVCAGVVWPQEKIDIMLGLVAQRLDLKAENSFIDLGCGGGWMLGGLKPSVGFAVGLDFSAQMLQNAVSIKATDALVQGEIGRLPLKDASFDRALCYFVLINMMDDAIVERAIMDMLRVVKPGGRLLIGQLPDQARSADYDRAKASYIDFCRQSGDLGDDLRDVNRMPQKLFDVPKLTGFLQQSRIGYKKMPSFNPFYRPGESPTIEWRFDLLLEK
ncbi:MAG: class I SAM-dependent methyltransferase [Candidatus Omnitrophica bacterium]|nr:class I SAM-dependent methyltransferase [Candidatus Omnitrophota bacterium]